MSEFAFPLVAPMPNRDANLVVRKWAPMLIRMPLQFGKKCLLELSKDFNFSRQILELVICSFSHFRFNANFPVAFNADRDVPAYSNRNPRTISQ